MKTPCKPAVRTYGTRHIELWCDTCKRMVVLGYKKASTTQADWEANQAKYWRDHLNTVLLAEKSLKSSPESVGGVIGDDDGLRESRRIGRLMEGLKYPSQK